MTQHHHEQRDVYIAFGVGGVALILILLYLFGGGDKQTVLNADGSPAVGPTVLADPQRDPSAYNYNIAPYNPSPGIAYASPVSGGGNGCCDTCGPYTGQTYNKVSVGAFQTLLGYGNALLAFGGAANAAG